METLWSIVESLQPREFLTSIDIMDAYLHVPIFQRCLQDMTETLEVLQECAFPDKFPKELTDFSTKTGASGDNNSHPFLLFGATSRECNCLKESCIPNNTELFVPIDDVGHTHGHGDSHVRYNPVGQATYQSAAVVPQTLSALHNAEKGNKAACSTKTQAKPFMVDSAVKSYQGKGVLVSRQSSDFHRCKFIGLGSNLTKSVCAGYLVTTGIEVPHQPVGDSSHLPGSASFLQLNHGLPHSNLNR